MTLNQRAASPTHPAIPPQRTGGGLARWIVPVAVIGVVGVAGVALKGSGVVSKVKTLLHLNGRPTAARPPVKPMPMVAEDGKTPADTSTGVDVNTPISFKLKLPNGPLDPATITDDAVGIFRFDTRTRVAASVKLVGDTLVATPAMPLEANKNYRVHLLPVLKDVKGNVVGEKTLSFFTTAQPPAGVAFEKVELTAAQGEFFTCTFVSVDRKLYASGVTGKLYRFAINADGTLGTRETFATINDAERGDRSVTGFVIDPQSDPAEPVIFVNHSAFRPDYDNVPDLTGKVSRLSGPGLSKIEDLVVHLPRSARDHTTNQPHFGPDGAMYFPQPSNNAVGGADAYWRMRDEHLLTATILRLDVRAFAPGAAPLDALTPDVGGTFDPAAAGSRLTIWCSGVRMPFDLLFHSNGKLYSSINGASSSGATPAGPGVAGIAYVNLAEHDWLFQIEKGAYYGHPNPQQGHFVLNGGNPTARPDFNEVAQYPVGTQPDSTWRPAIFDYGMHVSADGMIEYRSDRFGGALRGKIFVCRFNVGGDLLCLGLDAAGNVATAVSGIPGTADLQQPLDVSEDQTNGNLYVCEFGAQRITLLRPIEGATTMPAKTMPASRD